MKCYNCKKNITIFNKFYRKYGKAIVYYPSVNNIKRKIVFCSIKCYESSQ